MSEYEMIHEETSGIYEEMDMCNASTRNWWFQRCFDFNIFPQNRFRWANLAMMHVGTKRLQQRVEQPIMVRKHSDSGHLVVINVSIESFAGFYRLTIGPLVWQSCHTPMCQGARFGLVVILAPSMREVPGSIPGDALGGQAGSYSKTLQLRVTS